MATILKNKTKFNFNPKCVYPFEDTVYEVYILLVKWIHWDEIEFEMTLIHLYSNLFTLGITIMYHSYCWVWIPFYNTLDIKGWMLKNLFRPYFLFLMSWSDCIWSSKFLSLPPIIRGVLRGIGTRILRSDAIGPRYKENKIWAEEVF